MNTIKKIAKNTVYLFSAEIVSKISLFFFIVIIARYLGDVEIGKYSFVIAFSFFFIFIADIGLNRLIIREIAKDKSKTKKYISNIISIKIVSSIVSFLLLVIIINIIKQSPEIKVLVYLFGLSIIINTFANAFRSIFYAFEEIKYEAIIKVSENLIILILTFFFISLGYKLLAIANIFLLVSILNLLVSFFIVYKKFVKPNIWFDFSFCKKLIKESWPFALAHVLWIIYLRIDIIMLSFFKGNAAVGWYTVSYQIIEGLMFIPIIFMAVMFPVMSRLSVSDKESLKLSVEKSFKYLLILALPISTGTIILGKRFINLIYGSEFMNSVIPLQILMFTLIFIFVLRPFSQTLLAIGKQRLIVKIILIGGILNILLNLIFIPKLAHIGAAITTLISEIFVVFICAYFVSKYLFKIKVLRILFKPLIATIIMAVFIYLFINLNLILIVILSAIIYLILIFLLKIFDEVDIKFFREIISKH